MKATTLTTQNQKDEGWVSWMETESLGWRVVYNEEREERREKWLTRVGWSAIGLVAFTAFLFLCGIWTGEGRLTDTAYVFLAPAILCCIAWGGSKMEDSF